MFLSRMAIIVVVRLHGDQLNLVGQGLGASGLLTGQEATVCEANEYRWMYRD